MENYGRQHTSEGKPAASYGASKQERRELRQEEKTKEQRRRQLQRLYRRTAIWAIVLLGVGGAIFGMIKLAQSPADSIAPAREGEPVSVAAVAENDWVKGNRGSNVILIEYSDFQCPACASYYPLIERLADEFGNDIAVVYRHFPLGIFPHSRIAAQAAEAAGRQGKFWEMHKLIFDGQRLWANQRRGQAEETFLSYAAQLNLDIEQFSADTNSKETIDKINGDYQSGINARVSSVPTFFLNGERIQNPRSYEEFRALIQAAIAAN